MAAASLLALAVGVPSILSGAFVAQAQEPEASTSTTVSSQTPTTPTTAARPSSIDPSLFEEASPEGPGRFVVDDRHAGISPALAGVEVTSPEVTKISNDIRGAESDLEAAQNAERDAVAEQASLAAASVDLVAQRDGLVRAEEEARGRNAAEIAERTRLEAAAERARILLSDLVTETYVAAGQPENPLNGSSITESSRRQTYSKNLFELKAAERRRLLADRDRHDGLAKIAANQASAARAAANETDQLIEENRLATVESVERQASSQQVQADLAAALVELRKELAKARRTATVDGLDFTLVILDAFYRAQETMASERPGCGLDWALLAGISKVESVHGRFGTSKVDEFADVRPRIIGVALNGVGFALITDTDGGAYDGDAIYDRAVGPMQFIPGSWRIFGRDANGDGLKDPNNYYDAALAAAEHLCRGGADVSTTAGRNSAVLGYNQDNSYLAIVSRYAAAYAEFEIPWVEIEPEPSESAAGG